MSDRELLVSKKVVAHMLGVDERSVTTAQNRSDDPLPIEIKAPRRGQANWYCPRAVLDWKVRQVLAKLDVGDDGKVLSFEAERARLTKEQADEKSRHNRIADKEFFHRDLLEAVLASVCAQMSSVLASLPLKIKRRVPSLKASHITMIKAEIAKCQNAMSDAAIEGARNTEGTG